MRENKWVKKTLEYLPVITLFITAIIFLPIRNLGLDLRIDSLSIIIGLLLAILCTVIQIQERMKKETVNLKGLIENNTKHVEIIKNEEDFMKAITNKTKAAEICIDQVSMDQIKNSLESNSREKYDNTRNAIIKKNKIKYRYITASNDKRRKNFVKINLTEDKGKFKAGYYSNLEKQLPLINFIVFDRKHVMIRVPYAYGKTGKYYSIENKEFIPIFMEYLEQLWNDSIKIETQPDLDEFLRSEM